MKHSRPAFDLLPATNSPGLNEQTSEMLDLQVELVILAPPDVTQLEDAGAQVGGRADNGALSRFEV
jgi:hypothetical protein